MATLNAEGARHAQAELQMWNGEDAPQAMVKQVASTEVVRTTIARDMIDIAKSMTRSKTGLAEMQSLVSSRPDGGPMEALAVLPGKPFSIFDPSALPAACTEFLFGDCVSFLKRDTPVSVQQIFDALPGREELEYDLEGNEQLYSAADPERRVGSHHVGHHMKHVLLLLCLPSYLPTILTIKQFEVLCFRSRYLPVAVSCRLCWQQICGYRIVGTLPSRRRRLAAVHTLLRPSELWCVSHAPH